MQINGGSIASSFGPRPSGLELKSRPPVVLEVNPEFDALNTNNTAAVTTIVPEVLETASEQQSRFVRAFAINQESLQQKDKEQPALPKSVQHYLQVEQLITDDRGSLVDEMV
jgi:hypothetical protein